jgi:uncharacterized membrane protein
MANRLAYLGLGAALMYFYDPQAGRKRRADLQSRVDATQRQLARAREIVRRDATNRVNGLVAESRGLVETGKRDGLKAAGTSLVEMAQGTARTWQRSRWSPAQRAFAGALGSAFAAFGYFRGGVKGAALCALGGTLVARATANEELSEVLRSHGILVQKSIVVDAPVEQVFAYWRNLENLPQWMSHVREVRAIGGERYHWTVDGPAGVPVEWDSELLNYEENREMTWHSVGDSQVDHVGRVRFDDLDGGKTRIHVQMRYSPPGGIAGHAVAKAFGSDPRTALDDDLARMKTAVETGNAPRDGGTWGDGTTLSHARH